MSTISRDIHVAIVWEKALQRISREGDPHAMQLADAALNEARGVWASDEQNETATDAHEEPDTSELELSAIDERLRKIRATCLDFSEYATEDPLLALSSLACCDGKIQAAIRLVLMYLAGPTEPAPEDEKSDLTDGLEYTR